jgi:hypothetical protein
MRLLYQVAGRVEIIEDGYQPFVNGMLMKINRERVPRPEGAAMDQQE